MAMLSQEVLGEVPFLPHPGFKWLPAILSRPGPQSALLQSLPPLSL